MKLYSFQSKKSIEELQQERPLNLRWDRYSKNIPFVHAYDWMVQEMEIRGIITQTKLLFETDHETYTIRDNIQAALPYLKAEWIINMELLIIH